MIYVNVVRWAVLPSRPRAVVAALSAAGVKFIPESGRGRWDAVAEGLRRGRSGLRGKE
jgi:hypothetical protein